MVLKEGSLVEMDTPQNLLQNREGYFSKLWHEYENANRIE
jgi:hypothetical protein